MTLLREFDIRSPITAFGDLRTTELSPIIQHSFEYTVDNTDLTINAIAVSGSVVQATGMAVLETTVTTGSSAMLESKQHAKYKPGLGGLFRFTALYTSGAAGTEQYMGVMDETGSSEAFQNGYAIGYNGTAFSILVWRNDVLVTNLAQASWDDPLDGSGASGITLDPTKINVFEINFQYLGGGNIYFFVENENTGRFITAHQIKYANLNTEPSVYNPNFRATMWVSNKTTASNVIMKSSSFAYFVEGKVPFIELHQPNESSGNREKTPVTSEVAIFTIRNKATYAGKTNFIDIQLEHMSMAIEASSANNLGTIRLVRDATLGGAPSYSDINTNNSVVEIDIAGTTVTGGKELISIDLAGKNDREAVLLTIFDFLINPGESVTLAGLSANGATIDGSLLWKELF